jgi:hypothetical protein
MKEMSETVTVTSNSPGESAPPSQSMLTTAPPTPAAPVSQASSTPSASTTDVKFPENWKQGLPAEFQNEPSLKVIPDVPTLVKSYLNAQKLVGADKIPVPSKHATEDDWRGVFQKLGLPQDIKNYNIKRPAATAYNESFIESFKEAALKSNVLPKQAEAMLNWYNDALKTQSGAISEKQKQAQAKELSDLKTEWGAAFDNKLYAAQVAFKEFGDPEAAKYLEESGIGNNPKLLKMFARIGEVMKEDVVRGGVPRGDHSLMDPAQAKFEIARVMGDKSHPYSDHMHPNHAAAVQEMQKLYSMAYPEIKENK